MKSEYTHPAFELLNRSIENNDAARIAALLEEPAKLADDATFLAYCEVGNLGPANDWNGVRSTANKLKRDWEFSVLFPAQAIRFKAERERFTQVVNHPLKPLSCEQEPYHWKVLK
jgi:hypothetical protein